MDLLKITEVTERFKISSRTLRYYEQIGLLESERPPFETYRFYDRENISRLQQVLVLRKMQIPIKDIIRIYQNQDMEMLVQTFVDRMAAIDDEISTLSQLKAYVNEFLRAMTEHGVTQISALPLLYEKVEEQLLSGSKQDLSLGELGNISEKLSKPLSIDIVELPPMYAVSSVLLADGRSDIEAFWDWLSAKQIPYGKPGSRTLFEYHCGDDIVFLQALQPDQVVGHAGAGHEGALDAAGNAGMGVNEKNSPAPETCPFECRDFSGGLFAVVSAYTDDDLAMLQHRMVQAFDDNSGYEVDFMHDGSLRHETLIESVFSAESKRERVNIYLPLRQRKPNFLDYPDFDQVDGLSLAEIEEANPALRAYEVDFHKVTPVYHPHFQVLENGEAEFIAWISERKLDTNVGVRLPFRVDIEFWAEEESETYLWGTTEGSIWFSHDNCTYTMNAGNYADHALKQHALMFQQPLLENELSFPGIGDIPHNRLNQLTWIVGERHFAVILNGEVRFCAVNLPYMDMNLHLLTPKTILIGTNGQGKKRFRSIKITQLRTSPKAKTAQAALLLNVRQSNNILPNLRQIVHPEYGQNYWFNGCAAYLMECLGEADYDYSFFSGLTGDSFTQIYSKDHFRGNGSLDYRLSEPGNHGLVEGIFGLCAYSSAFAPLEQIRSDREGYVDRLMESIDKGLPVILNDYGRNPHRRVSWGVLVGYADYGKTLFYMGGDAKTPDSISVEDLLPREEGDEGGRCRGWLFIGQKQQPKPLADVYRDRLFALPALLLHENANYCFGPAAFRAWASDIENGMFEQVNAEDFDYWGMYTVYVCCLATNSGGCRDFLERALALNPDMDCIRNVMALYAKTGDYWNHDKGTDLEALGGGFNVTLEALQDGTRRQKIAEKLRAFADCMDEVITIIRQAEGAYLIK